MKLQLLNWLSIASIPLFVIFLTVGIDVGMGNYGIYSNSWTGTLLGILSEVSIYAVFFTGLGGSCYLTYTNFNQRNFGWVALNCVIASGWLLILYCIVGGMLGFF